MEHFSSRLKSLKNINKITSTMKIVSAAKYARAEKEISKTRAFGKPVLAFYKKVEVSLPQTMIPKTAYVAVTSDRGLCGSCNMQVCHLINDDLQKEQSNSSSLVCIGIVGTNILRFHHDSLIVLSVDNIGKKMPTFLEASEIAQHIKRMEDDFNCGKIVYNEYIDISSFRTQQSLIYKTEIVHMSPKLLNFGSVDMEDLESYVEFSVAMILFYAMRESYTSEQAARFMAMDSASNSAKSIEKKISVASHRSRQAAITRELSEIVATAMAQEKKN